MLRAMDTLWVAHQEEMASMKLGIHLRSHAKEDPQQAYKREAYRMFEDLLSAMSSEMLKACIISILR